MRKLLSVVLVIGVLFGVVLCFAQGDTHSQVIYTEIVDSGATTLITAIPVTKIRPDVDKILGMEVIALTSSTVIAALWDSATADISSGVEMISEFEATPYYAGGAFFPFPRYIVKGIVVDQTAYARVIIYYVRN